MARILVIEDEESILMALEDNLVMEGYDVDRSLEGKDGLSKAEHKDYDLIILDIMLPGMNGLDICRNLRQKGKSVPILMLTAKSQEIDKVLGLELGADDYVTKPFSSRELLARVKALLRRSGNNFPRERGAVDFGDVSVDFVRYEARKGGQPLSLTLLEFGLLRCLCSYPGDVISRDRILDEVWGKDVFVNPRTVDKHIADLRKKIEDDPARPRFILGIRGVGYKYCGD